MKLVEDWKNCWKWLSIHFMVLAAGLSALSASVISEWNSIPPEWQQIILNHYPVAMVFKIIGTFSVAGVIGRLIKQGKDNVPNG